MIYKTLFPLLLNTKNFQISGENKAVYLDLDFNIYQLYFLVIFFN